MFLTVVSYLIVFMVGGFLGFMIAAMLCAAGSRNKWND